MKNVLITGSSRGIGAAAARSFAAEGCRVFINYHTNHNAAKDLAEEIGGYAICADVADFSQVENMFNEISSICDGIDILINNAGFAQFSVFDALANDQWHRMLDVTLSGAFHCIKKTLPYMINQKNGSIINVSSIWGITGSSCEVAYSTAKAGLIGMTKALAKEVGPSGIRVNCVAPGVIDTDMNSSLTKEDIAALKDEIPLGRLGTPEEIAGLLVYLSLTDTYTTGQVISPNGGIVI